MNEPTVLVVDDNRFIRTLVRVALKPLGCEIVEAEDGVAALELAAEHVPDVVVLDVVMPKMDGFSVLEALRANPVTKGMAIVMLTTSATPMDRERSSESGADAYVVKPFDSSRLKVVVGELLDR